MPKRYPVRLKSAVEKNRYWTEQRLKELKHSVKETPAVGGRGCSGTRHGHTSLSMQRGARETGVVTGRVKTPLIGRAEKSSVASRKARVCGNRTGRCYIKVSPAWKISPGRDNHAIMIWVFVCSLPRIRIIIVNTRSFIHHEHGRNRG